MTWSILAHLARELWVVWLMAILIGVTFVAYRPRNKRHFENCARIPFEDEGKEPDPHV